MRKSASTKALRRKRIKKHIRKFIRGTGERPRLTVYRSLRAIYAQIIDDTANKTLICVCSHSKSLESEIKKAKGKVEVAHVVGKAIGEAAQKEKIKSVVFDRNGYLYHGRVKAVAEGAREAGLKF